LDDPNPASTIGPGLLFAVDLVLPIFVAILILCFNFYTTGCLKTLIKKIPKKFPIAFLDSFVDS
jgi:hypothetical protein